MLIICELQALTAKLLSHQIFEMCPYQSIGAGPCPPIFVLCALNDTRVPAWGPAKWVSKMRTRKVCVSRDSKGIGFANAFRQSNDGGRSEMIVV